MSLYWGEKVKWSCCRCQSPVLFLADEGGWTWAMSGGTSWKQPPRWGCAGTASHTPRWAHPVSHNPNSANPRVRGDRRRRGTGALAGLPAGGKAVKERVTLANDLIRAKPFPGGSIRFSEGPLGLCPQQSWAGPRGGLWLGWRGFSFP